MFKIAALYHFVHIEDCTMVKDLLSNMCNALSIEGGLIVASEGINGTISSQESQIDEFITALSVYPKFVGLSVKYSEANTRPFYRMRVRISPEIITMGISMENLSKVRGQYVLPSDWNSLISSPDVFVLDTRNAYEINLGTFQGAQNPNTQSFKEFPEFVEKSVLPKSTKIAMFCTGGIRCEKASSYLISKGYENVYQLEGGILKYLEEVPQEKSLWNGDCYVFDQRVSVKHSIVPGSYSLCRACRHALTPENCCHAKFREGVYCQFCYDSISEKTKQANEERHKQILLAHQRDRKHLGMRKMKFK